MTAALPPVRSKIVVQGDANAPALRMTVQLLDRSGHAVEHAPTPEAAVAAAVRADLLVLSLPDADTPDHWLDRLALLPAAERPRRVAILTEAEALPLSRRRLTDLPTTVLTRPVHAVGLLNLVKRLEASAG